MAPMFEARVNLVWHRLGKTTHSTSDSITTSRSSFIHKLAPMPPIHKGNILSHRLPYLPVHESPNVKNLWLHCVRPRQTWCDTDLAKRRILCQIPFHVITTSRSPPLPSLENHLNFPEPNAPHRRSFYLFLFHTRVVEPLWLGGIRDWNVSMIFLSQDFEILRFWE